MLGLLFSKKKMFLNIMTGSANKFSSSQVSPKFRGSGFSQRLILQVLKEPEDQTS